MSSALASKLHQKASTSAPENLDDANRQYEATFAELTQQIALTRDKLTRREGDVDAARALLAKLSTERAELWVGANGATIYNAITGEPITAVVDPTMTVSDVKSMLVAKVGYPENGQKLVTGGEAIIHDMLSLNDLGLPTSLQLLLRNPTNEQPSSHVLEEMVIAMIRHCPNGVEVEQIHELIADQAEQSLNLAPGTLHARKLQIIRIMVGEYEQKARELRHQANEKRHQWKELEQQLGARKKQRI